jgi:acyl-CoA thioester hydrolase
MGMFNHVNNVNFYRYFEDARAKYFDEVGIYELNKKMGISALLAESKCKFLQPLVYPDNLVVGAKVTSVGNTSFIMEYLIVSEKVGIAATGEGVLVMYDYNKSRKVSVPDEIRTAIAELEKRSS